MTRPNLYGGENSPKDTYMDGFALHQQGKVGDMTVGLPPAPYTPYPYFEWFTERNGRVVLELDREQVQVIRGAASEMRGEDGKGGVELRDSGSGRKNR